MQLRCCIVQLALFSGLVLTSSAQVDTGTITGRVTDPSGAVVPDVRVTVIQTETNFRFSTITNNEGIYRIQSLQTGKYNVTFVAPGFKQLFALKEHVGP